MNNYSNNLYLLLVVFFMATQLYSQNHAAPIDLLNKWESDSKEQPGVSVAILKSGEVIYKKSIGYANLEYQIPLDDNSIFDVASVAKQFTGFAIATLIVEGKLNLSDKAATYLPELGVLDSGILIKHLVYHTSGLRDVGGLFALSNQGSIFSSKEAVVLVEDQTSLNFSPGSEYDYSNTNYVLLALIVEKITNQSFRQWCDVNLFSPLKMMSSFANDNPYEIIKNRAVAYYSKDSSFSFDQNNGMSLIGSSAVYSNLNDMIIWTQALQEEVLFPEVFRLMKTKGELDNGEPIDYGLGLALGTYRGEDLVEHSGATPSGFRTQVAIMPSKELAFVVLSNWGDIDPIREISKVIINFYLSPKEENKKVPVTNLPDIKLSKNKADQFAGEYLFNNEMGVTIRSDDQGSLTMELEGQEEESMLPLSDSTFSIAVANAVIVFHSGDPKEYNNATVLVGGDYEGRIERKKPEVPVVLDHEDYQGLFHSPELNILFELEVANGKLYINNTKMGKVLINETSKETFVPVDRVASSIVFSFDENNEVDGFLLNRGSRVRNLKFFKIEI